MTTFIRKCPLCDCEISYTNKYNMLKAEKKHSKCKSCGIKNTITDDVRKKMSERVKGSKNPMYGKKHKLETIEKIKYTKKYGK